MVLNAIRFFSFYAIHFVNAIRFATSFRNRSKQLSEKEWRNGFRKA